MKHLIATVVVLTYLYQPLSAQHFFSRNIAGQCIRMVASSRTALYGMSESNIIFQSNDNGATWYETRWQPIIRSDSYSGNTYREYLSKIVAIDDTLYCVIEGVNPDSISGSGPFVQSTFGGIQKLGGVPIQYSQYAGVTHSILYHDSLRFISRMTELGSEFTYCRGSLCATIRKSPAIIGMVNTGNIYYGIDTSLVYRHLPRMVDTVRLPNNATPLQIVSNERSIMAIHARRGSESVFFTSFDSAKTWSEFQVSNPQTVKSIHFLGDTLLLLRNDLSCTLVPLTCICPVLTTNESIYPNPFSTSLQIGMPDMNPPLSFSIHTSNGQVVYSFSGKILEGSILDIDTQSFSQGVYYLRLQYPDRIITKVILKVE